MTRASSDDQGFIRWLGFHQIGEWGMYIYIYIYIPNIIMTRSIDNLVNCRKLTYIQKFMWQPLLTSLWMYCPTGSIWGFSNHRNSIQKCSAIMPKSVVKGGKFLLKIRNMLDKWTVQDLRKQPLILAPWAKHGSGGMGNPSFRNYLQSLVRES